MHDDRKERKKRRKKKKGSMLRAKAKQCWFSSVVMDAHLVSVVSLPAVVTLQQKEYIWIANTREDIIKRNISKNSCVTLYNLRFYLFWMRKKGGERRNELEIAISVNISTGNVHVSAKFRSVFMPNVLKRILFAVGQRELGG